MDKLCINTILNRENEYNSIKEFLTNFYRCKDNTILKKGIYLYGDSGIGKTTFIINLLKEMDFDVVKYDAGDIRNKSIIDTITKHNMGDTNILSMFNKKVKKIVIVMDEIDGMNNGDKGGINALIKIIRPKKTKKQKLEEVTINPIICIGNNYVDKKIKELMKVCLTVEMKTPTNVQITNLLEQLLPTIKEPLMKHNITKFVQGDLKKLNTMYDLYKNNTNDITSNLFKNIFEMKSFNDDSKNLTKKLINQKFNINDHLTSINETDRTIVGLLFHENIIDVIEKNKKKVSIPFYNDFLDNICLADYIDRITFQKQIWQFNEMSSLIKTLKNNKLYHDSFSKKSKYNPTEVRFTKVLTKYSTEYNNYIFIQHLCQELSLDKKDLFSFFLNIQSKYKDDTEIIKLFENCEITKLDINRILRYLDKYTKETSSTNDLLEEDDEEVDITEIIKAC
jgi:hypothetical protein